MSNPESSVQWRNAPVISESYNDLASLVALARRARNQIVEFDWYFREEELRPLQRAVYERGRSYAGRFRSFDARVLAAARNALQEPDTIYVLAEPKNGSVVASVSGEPSNGACRIHGNGPFACVFGYGWLAVKDMREALLPRTRATLHDSVAMLGWDVRRLSEEPRLRPVVNAIYGNPLNWGGDSTIQSPMGPRTDVKVHFSGPFVATAESGSRCLFTDPIARQTGVYLWTVNIQGGERVWYVGQTRVRFGIRTAQHLAAMLSGQYTTYNSEALAKGKFQRAGAMREGGCLPKPLAQSPQQRRALGQRLADVTSAERPLMIRERVSRVTHRTCRVLDAIRVRSAQLAREPEHVSRHVVSNRERLEQHPREGESQLAAATRRPRERDHRSRRPQRARCDQRL